MDGNNHNSSERIDTGEKLLLTRNDVARILSLSPATVSRRISDGTLPGVIRIGSNVRISKKALTEYIDNLSA